MTSNSKRKVGKRVGVSTVVAIGALATGISVAGAASNTSSPTATKSFGGAAGHSQPWARGMHGDLGVVGTVTAVNSGSITVKDPGGASTTYAITGATIVRQGGSAATAAQLTVGQNVAIMVSSASSSTAATIVIVPAGAPLRGAAGGVVTAVSSTSITVRDLRGATKTFAIDSATTVAEGRTSTSVSSITVGQRVRIAPSSSSASTAAAIEIDLAHLVGTVMSVSGNSITISDNQGFERTIQVSSATTYSKSGTNATVSDVQSGTVIFAEGLVDANHTTLDATNIGIGLPSNANGGVPGGPGFNGPMGPGPMGAGMGMMGR